jgi:hypothetical protein
MPAEAGIHATPQSGDGTLAWIPAYAGMTSLPARPFARGSWRARRCSR